MPMRRTSVLWTFLITSIGLFMVALDNLVVTTALPVIRKDLGSSLQDLEWMVNAYTLTFAVLLLTGAALGDRFGRRRIFIIGLAIFTIGSAAAALAPSSADPDPRPRDAGRRRRDRDAADPDDPLGGRAARSVARSRSARGAASAALPSRSARSSAARSPRACPGTGSSGSTCRSGSPRWCSRTSASMRRSARRAISTSSASRWRASAFSGSSAASSTATTAAGPTRRSSAP